MRKYLIPALFIFILGTVVDGCKKAAVSPEPAPIDWVLDASADYPYTMTAVVALPGRFNSQIKDGDQLAAFIDGECRGVGSLQLIGDRPVFFVLIHGTATEQQPVVFRYYSAFNSAIYYSRNEVSFSIDGNYGIVDEPVQLLMRKQ